MPSHINPHQNKLSKNGMESKNWFYAAKIVWPLLTEAAAQGKTLTYGEIAPKIQTNPLSVGRALGPIQDYCLQNHLPPLTAIVIGKISNEPGTGFIAWDIEDVSTAHAKVFEFQWANVDNPFAGFDESDTIESLASEIVSAPHAAAAIYRKVRVRGIAQLIFRRALISAYECRCAICGFGFAAALEAAHIIPWAKASHSQRLEPANGLLLCASHHKLVDANLMTVSRSLKVVYFDPQMVENDYEEFEKAFTVRFHGKPIRLPRDERHRPKPEYLYQVHRDAEWGDLP